MRKWLKDNDILIKLLSLLVATMLWFYVMDEQNPDQSLTYRGLEVQFKGLSELTEAGLVITEGNHSTVDVKIFGKRNQMVMVNRNTISVYVDVSSITVPGEYPLSYSVVPENQYVSYSRITPNVTITVDRMTTKSVPVQVELTGTPAEGFLEGGYSLSTDAVVVEGPERTLAAIDHAVVRYDMSGISESISTTLDYELVNEAGEAVAMDFITLRQPTVDFRLQVHQSGEIPLTVEIVPSEFITADMIELDIRPSAIRISGDPSVVGTINQISLGSIGVKQLLEDGVTEVTLPIILPNGVTSDSEESYARVTVTFKGLRQMMVSVNADRFASVEPYSIKEDGLNLSFWGTEEVLSGLAEEDITVTPVYNPADLVTGENVVPVSISAGGKEVSLVGKYTLTIIVPEELPPTDPDDPNNPEETGDLTGSES